jgi:hypothetical protein
LTFKVFIKACHTINIVVKYSVQKRCRRAEPGINESDQGQQGLGHALPR